MLQGYQRTYPKPAAQTLLGAGDDPLLVTWRYGLGRSAAFMSDLTGRWGSEWTQWSYFSRFSAQMARWAMRRRGDGNLTADFSVSDQSATITVDALDIDDQFINQLALTASITDQANASATIALGQTGPGRYSGTFPVASGQRYFVTVAQLSAEVSPEPSPQHSPESSSVPSAVFAPKLFGLVVPYSSEFLGLGVNLPLLEDLSRESGHGVLSTSRASLEPILAPSANASVEQRIGWPWFLLALAALIADVCVRKISQKQTPDPHH